MVRLESTRWFILDWRPSTDRKQCQQYDESYLPEFERLNSALSKPQQSVRDDYFTGWRLGATGGGIAASVVFLINLIVTIILATQSSHKGFLFERDCDHVQRINSALHIVINIFSTVLLSSSNYCMQCLSAPTRKEVDAAHARGRWLDIGVLGVRNLRRISTKRVVLWSLLGLSSLPLHLLYNSTVIASVATYDYSIYAIRQSLVDGPKLPNQGFRGVRVERLENIDRINAYAKMIQWHRGDVYLVVNDADAPSETTYIPGVNETLDFFWKREPNSSYQDGSYDWICSSLIPGRRCDAAVDRIKSSAAD